MLRRTFLLLAALAGACATWSACTHGGSPEVFVEAGAGGEGGGGESDAALAPDDFTCNPCQEVCACLPGDTFYSPQSCTTFTCPASGRWGGGGCLGPGCDEGGDGEARDGEAGDGETADAGEAGDAGAAD